MEITGNTMIMGSSRYGARFGTAVANVGDLNLDGYEGKQWSYKEWSPRPLTLLSMLFATFADCTMHLFDCFCSYFCCGEHIYGGKYKTLPKPHSL
jgi:hypothetical protein